MSDETARHSTLYVPVIKGLAGVMTIVLGSSPAETFAATFMASCPDMPGISVITRFAPENCVERLSENLSSIFAGAATSALSAGVEDNSLGCANAAVLARMAEAATTMLAI